MKATALNKIKLLLFLLVSLSLLGLGIYFVGKKQHLFNRTLRLSGIFKDASGLEPGNNVRFSGINVGSVESIEQISDSTIRINMQIESEALTFMKTRMKAVIGSEGLMGNRIIILTRGLGNFKNNPGFIETSEPVLINDILINLKTTCDNAADISGNLSAITTDICEGKGTVGKLFMDSVLAKSVEQTLINIKQAAFSFDQNMNAAGKNVFLRGYIRKKKKADENRK